jgi:hypothetical protein
MEEKSASERTRLVEERLRKFRSLRLDCAEVRASRDFHIRHFLKIAEAAIRADHSELYYHGLSANVQETVAGYPDENLPPAMQKTILRDLAFM